MTTTKKRVRIYRMNCTERRLCQVLRDLVNAFYDHVLLPTANKLAIFVRYKIQGVSKNNYFQVIPLFIEI